MLEEKSRIKLGSEKATIIRDSAIIIWDEAPMANKDNFGVVDELLRDIMKDVNARACLHHRVLFETLLSME